VTSVPSLPRLLPPPHWSLFIFLSDFQSRSLFPFAIATNPPKLPLFVPFFLPFPPLGSRKKSFDIDRTHFLAVFFFFAGLLYVTPLSASFGCSVPHSCLPPSFPPPGTFSVFKGSSPWTPRIYPIPKVNSCLPCPRRSGGVCH